jgi:hypothetical protein
MVHTPSTPLRAVRRWWALGLATLVPALGASCGESFSSAPGGAGGTGTGIGAGGAGTGIGAGGTGTGQGGVAVGGGGGLVSNGGAGGIVASGGGSNGGAGPTGGGGSGLASSGGQGPSGGGGQGQGGGPPEPGVLCGGLSCGPGVSCCYAIEGGVQDPICLSPCPTEQLEVSCDDQNDCVPGRICCYSASALTVACETVCNLTKLCVEQADCGGGECCEISDTGLYRCTTGNTGNCM